MPSGAGRSRRRRHGEARPFLFLLLVSQGALGLVNAGLDDQGHSLVASLIWATYGTTWLLLLMRSAVSVVQHRRPLQRQDTLLSWLLVLSLLISLVDVNVRLIRSQVGGQMLLLQGALLFLALLALFTYLYWRLDHPGDTPERRCFWWIPPPMAQLQRGEGGASEVPVWQPGFLDYLYLSSTVSFSFFPHVDPIRPQARLLVIVHLAVVFDVDLILLARAVSLIPS